MIPQEVADLATVLEIEFGLERDEAVRRAGRVIAALSAADLSLVYSK